MESVVMLSAEQVFALQIIGWIGTAAFMVGAWALSHRNMTVRALCPVACLIGNIFHGIQSIYYENTAIIGASVLLGILNTMVILRWWILDRRKAT